MSDQSAKASKEKKNTKVQRKKLKVEGDVTQPDEFIDDDRTAEVVPEVAKPLADVAVEEVKSADKAIVDINEDINVHPDSVREEIKQYKEQLLQSVAGNGYINCSKRAQDDEVSETEDVLDRIRERSASRSYEIPAPAPTSTADVLMELDETKLAELKEAFLLFDIDGDGCISHSDLRITLMSLGQTPDDNHVRKMLSEASNPLDLDAFVTLLGYRTLDLDSEETLVEALAQWDRAGSGLIPEERIRHDLMTWGDRFTPREVDWALEDAPTVEKRGDTMIDYVSFCKTLCGLRKANKKFNE